MLPGKVYTYRRELITLLSVFYLRPQSLKAPAGRGMHCIWRDFERLRPGCTSGEEFSYARQSERTVISPVVWERRSYRRIGRVRTLHEQAQSVRPPTGRLRIPTRDAVTTINRNTERSCIRSEPSRRSGPSMKVEAMTENKQDDQVMITAVSINRPASAIWSISGAIMRYDGSKQ